MCWPEANQPYENFQLALKQFEKDLHAILVFGMATKSKYIRVFDDDSSSRMLWVYVQRGTDNIIKVAVRYGMTTEMYGKETVDIYADDAILCKQLNELKSVVEMRTNLNLCNEIIYEDQVLVALKYPNLTINRSK